jgi:hypothetical protein
MNRTMILKAPSWGTQVHKRAFDREGKEVQCDSGQESHGLS